MTRSYASAALTSRRRITRPIRVVRRPRDPSITTLGFTCFRLVRGLDHGLVSVEVTHGSSTMFVFTRPR